MVSLSSLPSAEWRHRLERAQRPIARLVSAILGIVDCFPSRRLAARWASLKAPPKKLREAVAVFRREAVVAFRELHLATEVVTDLASGGQPQFDGYPYGSYVQLLHDLSGGASLSVQLKPWPAAGRRMARRFGGSRETWMRALTEAPKEISRAIQRLDERDIRDDVTRQVRAHEFAPPIRVSGDPDSAVLHGGGRTVPLSAQGAVLLSALIAKRGGWVSGADFRRGKSLAIARPDRVVSTLWKIFRTLGFDGDKPLIDSKPGLGYRLNPDETQARSSASSMA